MGRTPGATAAGTQQRLLRAAADVFARRGYEGARVADIAAAAELSNGALYSYFGSKAELLVEALRAHGSRLLDDLVAADPARSISRPAAGHRPVAAPAARRPTATWSSRRWSRPAATTTSPPSCAPTSRERADWLAALVREAQARGELDPAAAAGGGRALLPLPRRRDRPGDPRPARRRRRGVGGVPRPPRGRARPTHHRTDGMRHRESPDRLRAPARATAAATTSRPTCSARTRTATPTLHRATAGGCPPGREDDARLAVANCPESAIDRRGGGLRSSGTDDRFAQDYTELRRDPSLNRYNEMITGPVTDWATDFSHLEPEYARGRHRRLGRPARALPGRAHRAVRRRLAAHPVRRRRRDRLRHRALLLAGDHRGQLPAAAGPGAGRRGAARSRRTRRSTTTPASCCCRRSPRPPSPGRRSRPGRSATR